MATATTDRSDGRPLCVDLDGTLVNTDTLIETALALLKRNPLYLIAMLYWLFSGKANLKDQIARRTVLDVSLLPYNRSVLKWLQSEHDTGRELVLVSACNYRIAQGVAAHLGLFSEVVASSDQRNMSAATKRDELNSRYGPQGYDYAGNSSDDLPVWADSHRAIVVHASTQVEQKARAVANVERVFASSESGLSVLLRAMRPHQWTKNLLIFVNLIMAHQLGDAGLLWATVLAFVAFCLCASGVYLINDLLDLDADRQHATKSRRPVASGTLALQRAAQLAPLLLLSAFVLAAFVGPEFLACMALYFAMTLLYSLFLKRVVILDVLILALLYTLRIVAGATVAVVMPSFWLMSFAMFLFASLAMAKRYAELKSLASNEGSWAAGRGYHVADLPLISNLGVAAGYLATLVLALYVNSPAVLKLYSNESFIWLLCPMLLYWIGRIWLLAGRGQLDQDPVIFATRDPVSYLVAALGLFALWAAV